MNIGSLLRGGLPSFYSTEVLLPLIILGKGLPQTAKERGQLLSWAFGGRSLRRVVVSVHRSGWRRLTSPSTLFLGGWPTTTAQLYAGMTESGLPPIRVAWTVRSLPSLSSCSAQKRTELTLMWSIPSRRTAREEVF
jgi:hypothetical protein